MKTDELIERLADGLAPVPRHAVEMRLARGIGVGAIVSLAAMWMWLGIRPDLMHAMGTMAYWTKFGFTLSLAGFALWATDRLARPALRAGMPFAGIALVFAVLFFIAMAELMSAAPASRMPLVMGHSSHVCPWRIAILSLPIFAGMFWSLRALAPSRLVLAGAVAGVASGALGAWIYAFHCNESAAPFVFVFYTLGIGLLGIAGAFVSRRLLRW